MTMTPLEKLKALNDIHGNGCDLEASAQDWAFFALKDELLALWEAMNEPVDLDDHTVQLSLNMENALARLNAKAAEVLK